jgi:hypothetical protein
MTLSGCGAFSTITIPVLRSEHCYRSGRRSISCRNFQNLGMPTANVDIRQLVVRFGASGYIVRYASLPPDILITRIWHGREERR